ncbi:DUF6376 family protein [Fredinandcohnia humi]
MKKQFLLFSLLAMIFLGGCSLLEDVNNTVSYVSDATDYMNEVSKFIEEAPTLAEQAITDEQARVDLENMLQDMKDEMNTFNSLQAPDIAADLHQQIVDQNQQAKDGIDLYLKNIENGTIDPSVLENSEVLQSLQEITSLIDQIKQLGE